LDWAKCGTLLPLMSEYWFYESGFVIQDGMDSVLYLYCRIHESSIKILHFYVRTLKIRQTVGSTPRTATRVSNGSTWREIMKRLGSHLQRISPSLKSFL
jgi:hypothetical protein